MVKQSRVSRPNSVPWPPLLYAGAAAAGLVLQYGVWRPPWPAPPLAWLLAALGAAAVIAAIVLDLAALREFRRHRTTILPHRGASTLITSGPFALSRNPIYLGNTLLVGGLGLILGSAWLILAAPVGAVMVQKLAIEREEEHLAANFGAAWTGYAGRTPRWFRLPWSGA